MKSAFEQLVTLQKSTTANTQTIFCFPGAGDSVTCFLSLADSMGTHCTVHGIQPRGLDGSCPPHSTVEDAVHDNIEAVRKTYPGGPYKLLGHSFGGWIAFEMACQLLDHGEQVDTLVLLDTDPPAARNGDARNSTRIDALMELITNLEDKAAQRLGLDRSNFNGLSDDAHLIKVMNAMKKAGLYPPAAGLPTVARMFDVFAANLHTGYVPAKPLAAQVLLVHPQFSQQSHFVDAVGRANGEGRALGGAEAFHAWQAYAARMERIEVPGTHMSMLSNPSVEFIARSIRQVWRN